MTLKISHHKITFTVIIFLFMSIFAFGACSKQSVQKAGEGATTGAVVGAVGGMVSAMVFGGDVGEATARGAVWGGSTGAASGAMSGAMAQPHSKPKPAEDQTQKLTELRQKLGEDAYNGLEALVNCKHEVAVAYGRTAAKSDNQDHALAGLWIEVLSYADSRQEEKARALYSDVVTKDDAISSESQAETKMRNAMQKLMQIRKQYDLPEVCS